MSERYTCWYCDDEPGQCDACDDRAPLIAEIDQLRALVNALTSNDECSYDHNGYCQTHYHHPPCPHAVAKKLLGE